MINKKVALVSPATSKRYVGIDTMYRYLPPGSALPIVACETEHRLVRACKEVPAIRVFDNTGDQGEWFEEIASSDIVGISSWFSNHPGVTQMAEQVKSYNPHAIIVVGGPNASNLGQRMLANNPSVDFVVAGDGEDALWRIVDGQPTNTIPNIWYRDSENNVHFSFGKSTCLDNLDPFDFRHVVGLDLEQYDSRKPGFVFDEGLRPPIAISITRGCPRAAAGARCRYCSLPGVRFRTLPVGKAWEQMHHLFNLYGIVNFFETGDDLAAGDVVERMAAYSGRFSPITLRGYCSLPRLTVKKIEAMARLGVTELFIGLETTNEQINDLSGHPVPTRRIDKILYNLDRAGISVSVPFLFGLPGESPTSVKETAGLALRLVEDHTNVRRVLVSLAMPLVGSAWFAQLAADPHVRSNYRDNDLDTTDDPNYARLLELSVDRHCTVSMSSIIGAIDKLRDRLRGKVQLGCFGGIDSCFERQGVHYVEH